LPILGAHMSIAGGYYKSVGLAKEAGCDCVQLFTKNNNQWKAKPITEDEATKFQQALLEHKIQHPIAHASYLINLASPNEELRAKSIEAFTVELQRADLLGIPFVVLHPGSYTTSDETTGLNTIARSLNTIHQKLPTANAICLLENTAGQGSNLGNDFSHLKTIIDQLDDPQRIGVCFDTCHAFAAGYAMETRENYEATVSAIESSFGLARLKAFHLNDSKKPFGSRKDRHEAIGKGEMGLEPFRHLMNDPRVSHIPMYLETPKESSNGTQWDRENLATLRSLVES
jgi:deoxyribonuclease-4